MVEHIVFMQVEDNMVTFEKENGDTIIYPITLVPTDYKEGDIIKVINHSKSYIEFIELDKQEMEFRKAKMQAKKLRLRERAKRSTK